MPIRVLPPQVAARIAAGEVVEGPASAVKELVENALDAGASAIGVEMEAGGLELIRVTDNGEGIASEDVAHLFQRHATSKLTSDEELEDIGTLGFRGEALHSLVAVAQVTLVTRRRGEESGSYIAAQESRVVRQEPRGAPVGTTVTARQLFQNVPARLKFLRSPQAAGGRVQRVVSLYVLAYPGVRFSLASDGRTVLTAPGNGGLQEAVRAVYGGAVAQALLPVSGESGDVRVGGLVSPPDVHRANRSYITLIVNGRPVQNRSLTFAVAEAYQGLLPGGRSPIAVISVSLPRRMWTSTCTRRRRRSAFARSPRSSAPYSAACGKRCWPDRLCTPCGRRAGRGSSRRGRGCCRGLRRDRPQAHGVTRARRRLYRRRKGCEQRRPRGTTAAAVTGLRQSPRSCCSRARFRLCGWWARCRRPTSSRRDRRGCT